MGINAACVPTPVMFGADEFFAPAGPVLVVDTATETLAEVSWT